MKLVKILLTLIIVGGWSHSSWSQAHTEQVENISVSKTKAQLLGKTEAVRDLVSRVGNTSISKKNAAKKLKTVPNNFLGRRSQGNAVHKDLEHQGPDPIRQKEVSPPTRMMSSEPIINIDGLTDSFGSPTDPTGDVSSQHYIQSINVTDVGVFDIEGNLILEFEMNDLWAEFGAMSLGDPIILYDEISDRWILTEFTGPANLLVAISETNDPLGSYFAYSFATPNFPDYPKYSISPEAIVVTTNERGGADLHQYFLDKQALMDGADDVSILRVEIDGNGNTEAGFYVTTPVDWNGQLLPFDTRPITMAINDSSWPGGPAQDQVEIYRFNLDFDVPNNTTVDRTSIITTPFDSYPCSAISFGFHCVPQRGGAGLDALPELILNVPHQRNFGTHESLVFNFVTDVTDGENLAGMRWVELRRTATEDWSLYQEGTFAPDDGLDRFMGGIAIDELGTIAMAYNVTSEDQFVGMAYTARFATDPLGVMTLPEVNIVEGSSAINSGGRFGDYTQMSVMPDRNRFWFTGEYAGPGGTRTRIVSFELAVDTFDLAATAITQPVDSDALTTAEIVVAEFTNVGLSPLTNFDVTLMLDGVAVVTDNVAMTLESRQTYTHTFSQAVNLSELGSYELSATITNPSDVNDRNNTTTAVVRQLLSNDGGLSARGDDNGCSALSPFELTITNDGFQSLQTATIAVLLNGTEVDQIDYQGNLAFQESETFTYEAMIPDVGDNSIEFVLSMANGERDETEGNSSGELPYFQNGAGRFITLNITADEFPAEVGWTIETLDGTVLQSGDLEDTPDEGFYTKDICIQTDSCYNLVVTDAAGDGLCCLFGEGNIEILTSDGDVLLLNDGNYGFVLERTFCEQCEISSTVDVGDDINSENTGSILVEAQGAAGPYQYSIDNGLTFQDNALFTNLAAGEYEVVVIAGDGVCQESLLVTVPSSTSLVDLSDEFAINMFPNPTKGVFDIEIVNLNYDKPLLTVEILNNQGKFVYSRQLGNYDGRYIGTFSLMDYPQGVYYLKLANTDGGVLKRIMKVD